MTVALLYFFNCLDSTNDDLEDTLDTKFSNTGDYSYERYSDIAGDAVTVAPRNSASVALLNKLS